MIDVAISTVDDSLNSFESYIQYLAQMLFEIICIPRVSTVTLVKTSSEL